VAASTSSSNSDKNNSSTCMGGHSGVGKLGFRVLVNVSCVRELKLLL